MPQNKTCGAPFNSTTQPTAVKKPPMVHDKTPVRAKRLAYTTARGNEHVEHDHHGRILLYLLLRASSHRLNTDEHLQAGPTHSERDNPLVSLAPPPATTPRTHTPGTQKNKLSYASDTQTTLKNVYTHTENKQHATRTLVGGPYREDKKTKVRNIFLLGTHDRSQKKKLRVKKT